MKRLQPTVKLNSLTPSSSVAIILPAVYWIQDHFYQRVSVASYASAGIARAEMSVRPSVRHTPVSILYFPTVFDR